MRPVTASHALKRGYNKAVDDSDGNPFSSMYQQNFGAAKSGDRLTKTKLNTKLESRFATPQK